MNNFMGHVQGYARYSTEFDEKVSSIFMHLPLSKLEHCNFKQVPVNILARVLYVNPNGR